MDKYNIIKDLFDVGEIEIEKGLIPWGDVLYNQLIDWYHGTNSALNINNIDYIDDYRIIVSDDFAIINVDAFGDDGEYGVSIYLSATILDDFESIADNDYSTERTDPIEFDGEEDE